ncbi:P-loop containing nucleoside triphosphate hydrolase protein [Pseudoneurospora amorphoporcata]|uniref:P-loop containing nucleoside triphosphate hydrolase protein n=1 Tax=Pseudoneurospora amorphoporcata TaxID=241081 RepID=A0AAN6P014_9PEZI|nr:P-loop containing nucleoside triphosphate hydrolase protein [Pseudoneurospora amorphoporcata]
MSVTGVGKSTFINQLKPGSAVVGHTMESTTQTPQAVKIVLDEAKTESVTVVDTPGFDDTWRSDEKVLEEIAEYMATQYVLGVPLKGIIYMHSITEVKMKGSSRKFLEMFQSLCGDAAMKKIALVTTHWDSIKPEDEGDARRREQELIDKWWAPMLDHGSWTTQYNGTRESAGAILVDVAESEGAIVLDVQRELVDDNKKLGDTMAGLPFKKKLDKDIANNMARNQEDENIESMALEDELEQRQQRLKANIGERIKMRIARIREELKNNPNIASGVRIFTKVLSLALTIASLATL